MPFISLAVEETSILGDTVTWNRRKPMLNLCRVVETAASSSAVCVL